MLGVSSDLAIAVRRLRQQKLLALVCTVGIALTIAANVNVFGGMRGLLLGALPYDEPDRLVYIWQGDPNITAGTWLTPANHLDITKRSTQLDELSALRWRTVNVTFGAADSQPIAERSQVLSTEVLSVLRAAPAIGRGFSLAETRPGAEDVVIVSDELWREHFDTTAAEPSRGDLGVLTIDGREHRVVGVMPPGFELLDPTTRLWLPLVEDPSTASRSIGSYFAIGRLAPEASVDSLRAELAGLENQLEQEHPRVNRELALHVSSLRDRLVDPRTRSLVQFALGAVVFLLMITASNLTNLLYAQGESRRSEIATRLALGAGRRRLIGLVLTESILLAVLGGTLGLALAALGHRIIAASPMWAQVPFSLRPQLDWAVVTYSFVLSIVVGVLVGLLPALRLSRPSQTLRAATARHAPRRALSRTLVVVQMSFALVLMAGAGVMVQSFQELEAAAGGYDDKGIVTLRLSLPRSSYPEASDLASAGQEILDNLRSRSGVQLASLMMEPPRSPGNSRVDMSWLGADPADRPSQVIWLPVATDYFELLRIPILTGRGFLDRDRLTWEQSDVSPSDVSRVAVVNRALAERFFPEGAIGQRVRLGDDTVEIIGVAANTLQEMTLGDGGPPPVAFVAHAQSPTRSMLLAIRGEADVSHLATLLSNTVSSFDSEIPLARPIEMKELLASFFVGFRLYAGFMGLFGLVALAIAALGIYGVTAFSVARRLFELAVRRALGANGRDVVWLVLREGLGLALGGLLIGIPGVVLVARGIASTLTGTAPISPAVAGAVIVVLAGVALAGSLVPALTALRAHPASALRSN